MSNYAQLRAGIRQVIKQNGQQEITGNVLQNTLLSMVNSMGVYYEYAGIATAETAAGTPDQNVFYLAPSGIYGNFGANIEVPNGYIGVFMYDGQWRKDSVRIYDYGLQVERLVKNGLSLFSLADRSKIINGGFISPNDGILRADNRYSYSDFMPATPGTAYTFTNIGGKLYGAFYDETQNYLRGLHYDAETAYKETFTSPSRTAYIKVSALNDYAAMMTIGTSREEPHLNGLIQVNEEQVVGLVKDLLNIIPTLRNILTLGERKEGYFVNPNNGGLSKHPTISYTTVEYTPIEANTAYHLQGFGKIYGAWSDANKVYISGINEGAITPDITLTSPTNAAFLRISTETEYIDGISISKGNIYLNKLIKVKTSQVEGLDTSTVTTLTVKPNGGGDFTKISSAIAEVNRRNPNPLNRFVIEFYGNGTNYNLLTDSPYVSGGVGILVPPFTKLVGVGGKEKCILVRRLPSLDQYDSAFTLHVTSELEGFTVIANNTRYVIHDDERKAIEFDINYERYIKDCDFIGEKTYYDRIIGAGTRSGARWHYVNCNFINASGAINDSFSCHNNTGFNRPSQIEFVNCRFLARGNKSNSRNVWFGSITKNANGINNYITFKGCKIGRLWLYEEGNPETYGRGILWKVSGYANDLLTGSPDIQISATDGKDYSGNVDLI